MIRWSALLRGRPVADVATLVEVVYQTEWPMDFDSILASPIEFHPLATDAATGASTDLRALISDPAELRLALRASAALPFLAGPPVRLRGRRYYDAGVTETIPFRTPVAQGATHILVLRSRRPFDFTDDSAADGPAVIAGRAAADGWVASGGEAATELRVSGDVGADAVATRAAAAGRAAIAARAAAAGRAAIAARALRQAQRRRRIAQIGQHRPPPSYRLLTRTALRNESPEFRTALLTRAARTATDIEAIADWQAEGRAFTIFPPASVPPVSRLTTDSVLLEAALESGREAVDEVFAEDAG
jgi:predicted acylesterase/phospholipase RssA